MYCSEVGYLRLLKDILTHGEIRKGRNGATRSLFGTQLRIPLSVNKVPILPLLTTKYVPFRLVHEELKWFVQGRTDNKYLLDNKVRIWDTNAKAGPLWKEGEEEDLGPIYGFQWRHFGADYKGCITPENTYEKEGVDQISWVVDELRRNPGSRRAIINAWNPVDIPKMTLPPCHVLSQYWIGEKGLSCHMYQRSADIGLGVPFNIASYALLTHAIAKSLGINANELVMSFGDTHIYESHIYGITTQMFRKPGKFPTLIMDSKSTNPIDILCDEENPCKVEGYVHQGVVRLPMIA